MSTPAEELAALLRETFPLPDNRAAVEWLSTCTSAHGDLAQRLEEVVRPLPLKLWEPDGDFPFVVVHDERGRIHGAAVGMRSIYVRVPRDLGFEAAQEGERVLMAGPSWYRFDVFSVDRTHDEEIVSLRRWFESAIEA